jgi:hypothetical protein
MNWKYVFVILTLHVVMLIPCQSEELDIKKAGVYELKLSPTKETLVRCSIRIDSYNPIMHHARCWGSDWENPRTIISTIKLWVNEIEVAVPLSSYADVSDPNRVELSLTRSGYRLTIRGGDAATSYQAAINFCGNSVISRKVQSGEFPDEDWEMTIYSNDETPHE